MTRIEILYPPSISECPLQYCWKSCYFSPSVCRKLVHTIKFATSRFLSYMKPHLQIAWDGPLNLHVGQWKTLGMSKHNILAIFALPLLHDKNKCWVDSKSDWHVPHINSTSSVITLCFFKLSLYGNGFLRALHTMNATLFGIFNFHNKGKVSLTCSPSPAEISNLYAELVEYNPESSCLHLQESVAFLLSFNKGSNYNLK